ncbi:penicillin acylase family protein [Actinocrinis puniceicyclus]|uniref:Penicillin acylase family protein n=1 Tax=Actinocrinis puniceicyclus TaxID=977794 RepID=A0A8J7WNW1_9ACTN|nr:penicillin acylase family protein [Actinocrinis puniceicyclus]MBS2963182.1 penicillin acylase family protein [Actinocrinis puniceicyclus]
MRRSRTHAHPRTHILAVAAAAGALVLSALAGQAHAAAPAGPTDYCAGQCSDILPPGENGAETLADIVLFKLFGIRPAHNNDQLGKYDNLVTAYTGLTTSQIDNFYNDSSYGVPPANVERTETPQAGVTIVRDSVGIPHIYGQTRAETEFGAGYAGAEDRLWVMDLFRHIGRAELTSFAGGAPANRALEQNLWRSAPYTEVDLQSQVAALAAEGTRGAQLKSDIDDYLAGVNDYIALVRAGNDFPGEYDLTGQPMSDFTETDVIAIAAVIGGLFGNGGGGEVQSALVKQAAEAAYGVSEGDAIWAALREQNDPETTLTLHAGQSFPYGETSGAVRGVAMPDSGSVSGVNIVQNATGSASGAAAKTTASARSATSAAATAEAVRNADAKLAARLPAALRAKAAGKLGSLNGIHDDGALPGLNLPAPGQQHPGMSNALVISAADSASGHPIAVFGPQTGYFAPQLLMLEEIEGPGLSARGASFAGLNLYVELGRGPSYSWSATSSEQDTTDTYAVTLCNPDGSTPSTSSTSYLFHGVCTPMDRLVRHDSWSPTVADTTAAGSYDLTMYRTKYGLVEDTATISGVPVAYTSLRSTYMHEADSAIGFQMFNDPGVMSTPQGFESAASNIGYDFNWFYVDSAHAAYFNSGLNPVRASGTDPNLPMWGTAADEWQGWNPADNTADYTPPSAHPNSVDQDYYVSWNNKQAVDYSAADGNFSWGPVQRSDLLDQGVKAYLATGARFTRPALVQVMERAAVTDLRGRQVLPLLLQVINSQPVTDPGQQALVNELTAWLDAGATLTPTASGSKTYQNAAAIQVFDAWWPLLVQAEFQSGMGTGLFNALLGAMQANESPSGGQQLSAGASGSSNQAQPHKGSSFQFGWWGYVSKDLRGVLGRSVSDPLPVKYCGGGSLSACRGALLSSLTQAAAESASTVYSGDSTCSAGDQWCADSIIQDPLGGITDGPTNWQNRPTFQQVVEYPSGP